MTQSDDTRLGDWVQTATGRVFWPIDPRPEEIHIEDIAHALSNLCRFGGHCRRFYSVAEHSLLVSTVVPARFALWGLLHDASEAYLVDVPRPIKPALAGYAFIEAQIMDAVATRFGLPPEMPAEVKCADNAVLADEAEQIMRPAPRAWHLPEPPTRRVDVIGLSPGAAKYEFLKRFYALKARV